MSSKLCQSKVYYNETETALDYPNLFFFNQGLLNPESCNKQVDFCNKLSFGPKIFADYSQLSVLCNKLLNISEFVTTEFYCNLYF